MHNLWDTMRAAAGTYWAELSADVHLRGLLTTLATRAARTIASLANTVATQLEQRDANQQPRTKADEPNLRQSYINARNQIRAHAATHEWQRITATWGTVNTLSRQANDPGIRAIIARSADAISDYADSLARKISQLGHDNSAAALRALAAAAEHRAKSLRSSSTGDAGDMSSEPEPTASPLTAANSSDLPLANNTAEEARLLQARARQVAHQAEARLGLTPRRDASATLRAHGANPTHNRTTPSHPTPSNSPHSTHVNIP